MKILGKFSLSSAVETFVSRCNGIKSRCIRKECNTNPVTKNDLSDSVSQESKEMPVACLLTGRGYTKRKAKLQKDVFSKMLRVSELENGYSFYYKYNEAFFMSLSNYIITENRCCPFFTFHVRLHAQEDIQLKVLGTKKAKEMIKNELIDKIEDHFKF